MNQTFRPQKADFRSPPQLPAAPGRADPAGAGESYRSAKSPLKVLFVTRKWPPAIGGMETLSVRLVEALRPLADLSVIVLPGRQNGDPPGVWALLRFGVIAAIRLLLARPPQIAHIGDMASWPLAVFARLRSRSTRIVISAHGTDVSLPLRGGAIPRLYGWYLKLGAKLLPSATVIANSAATAMTAKRYGFDRIAIVPLGTDIGKTVPFEAPGNNLLFVGRLAPRKGCAWFVRTVLPLLPPEITLKVAGNVWADEERAALDTPRVDFLGSIQGETLAHEYATALCVVIPTRDFEGFGLTAIEAAASGGVVLASDHSGLRQSVINGVTGFLVDPDNPREWAERIRAIQAWSQEERDGFRDQSLATVKARFSWDRVARDVIGVYLSNRQAID